METSIPFPFGQHVLDPMFDIGFKLIFGREHVSEPLIVSLLNSIFRDDPKFGNIVSVNYKNTEYPNEWMEGKGIRYDIRCETADHRHFIVEMQKAEQEHFLERCYYYVGRAIAAQGYRGKRNGEACDFSLEPVVGVFFCNFHVKELPPYPEVKARLTEDMTRLPIGDYERYVFIQIPFFQQEEHQCHTELEKWIYNIKNMGRMQKVAFTIEDTFKYLRSVSDVAALPLDEREIYEAELMKARDYNACMKTAKKRAMEEGMAVGIAEGRAEGMAQGIEEGKMEVAKKMLEKGVDKKFISEITGISLDRLDILI